jgi:hypothetical protein
LLWREKKREKKKKKKKKRKEFEESFDYLQFQLCHESIRVACTKNSLKIVFGSPGKGTERVSLLYETSYVALKRSSDSISCHSLDMCTRKVFHPYGSDCESRDVRVEEKIWCILQMCKHEASFLDDGL